MHDIYSFVSGPLVWVAFIIFIGGSLVKILSLWSLCKKKDGLVFEYWSWSHALHSIIRWLIPFATLGWKNKPGMAIATSVFHLGVVIMPLFVYAHVILIKEAFDISWGSIPDGVADTMSVVVVVAATYFIIRRITQPEVRYVTSCSDFVVLAIAIAPFVILKMVLRTGLNNVLMVLGLIRGY